MNDCSTSASAQLQGDCRIYDTRCSCPSAWDCSPIRSQVHHRQQAQQRKLMKTHPESHIAMVIWRPGQSLQLKALSACYAWLTALLSGQHDCCMLESWSSTTSRPAFVGTQERYCVCRWWYSMHELHLQRNLQTKLVLCSRLNLRQDRT